MPTDRRRLIAGLAGLALGLAALAGCSRPAPETPPVILAAASLQGPLDEALALWAAQGHPAPVVSYAGSSALARQVEAGAPTDLFISADEAWMDALARKQLIRPDSRAALVGNRLVLIAPAASTAQLDIRPGMDVAALLDDGRLAMADPEAVPAGRYGKAALTALGAWTAVANRVAPAENVRAALALVERGAAPLGVVYATDARASSGVRVVGVFPENSHPPIVYPIAVVAASKQDQAEPLRQFLLSVPAQDVLARHGFSPAAAP
ncbi:MAG TPA: molybdate ABC transporter substrate-binding protein [Brevundimonas sp.]|uniref:molybdate ABC transporter substrate-binding protein n=1 Tax=Brevundimonas sp. TaxID=1871086 RepID=UPI0026246E84|nr:molybdate ABC transporter substrate-binding protein [Brevundimonas sp.]HRO32088.1 molybdate ABC transporter substrate-binding protein [Brevundimonas sp.]